MNNEEEIIKVMGMGMSDDIETMKLAESLLKELTDNKFNYNESLSATLDWYVPDYYYFHWTIIKFRNKYFPRLIYSPYTKTFKGYVGS